MHATSDTWAAAKLVAFANLDVTPDNWRTLWDESWAYLTHRFGLLEGPRQFRIPQQWARRLRRLHNLQSGAVTPPGELWRAFVEGAVRAATGDVDGHSGFEGATIAIRFFLLSHGLPPVGRDGRVIEEREFRALHRRTREWLRRVYMADEPGDLMSALRRYRVEYKLTISGAEDYDVAGVLTSLRQEGEKPAAWTWRGHRFTFVPPSLGKRQPLADVIEGLFVTSGLGGLWPRFFQCAAPRCTHFGVSRVIGRARNFCSDACKARTHRLRAYRVKAVVKRERMKAEAVRKAGFMKLWRELQAKGDCEAWEKTCAEFEYGPAGPPDE